MIDARAQDFNHLFHALADPYRRGFIEQLAKKPSSVTELAATTDVQLPAVLKHLRVLEESGIVMSEKIGRIRTYQMQPGAFTTINHWIKQRQVEMNAAFDRLAVVMADMPEEKDH